MLPDQTADTQYQTAGFRVINLSFIVERLTVIRSEIISIAEKLLLTSDSGVILWFMLAFMTPKDN